jgi:hypothetical protein
MTGALVYLQLTSLRNAARQRWARLRQPRYLIGLIVGFAYFYLVFFRRPASRAVHARGFGGSPGQVALLVGLGMLLLFMAGRIAYAWIFSAERAALAFTEAEVSFLFPAPISRRALVHFKLLKSQLRILLSALLIAVFSNRFGQLGGSAWIQATGWWILLSTLELHGIGASFTRDRLLNLGLNPTRRRILFGGAAALLVAGAWWWIRDHVPPPGAVDLGDATAFISYLEGVAAIPPLPWVLAPFRWLLGPFFAANAAALAKTLGPALLVLGAHYVWVVRSEVSFEEASIDLARRRAERLAAVRAGSGWRGLNRPSRRRGEPFRLRPHGPAPLAFLWRNLISAGPWFYPRNALLLSAALLGAMLWLAASPSHRSWLVVVQATALPVSFWVLFAVPMLLRRQVQLLLERLDVIKTFPLRGWQVLLGEMLAPIVLITAIEWLLLALLSVATGALSRHLAATALLTGLGGVGIGLLVPPVAGLMVGIPFAATLFFPGWMSTVNQPRGMDVMGQRLIFAGAYLLVLLVALLPAALTAAVPYLVVQWLVGEWRLAVLAGAIAASLVLAGELAAVIWWLGRRYEQFDLSTELPQG